MELQPSWAYITVLLYIAPPCVFLVFIGTAIVRIWSWTAAKRMYRRIQYDLDRPSNKGDLTSIKTWMAVDEVEARKRPGSSWAPQPSTSVNQGSAWVASPEHRNDYVQLVNYNQLMAWHTRHDKAIPLMDVPVRLFRINYDRKNEKQ